MQRLCWAAACPAAGAGASVRLSGSSALLRPTTQAAVGAAHAPKCCKDPALRESEVPRWVPVEMLASTGRSKSQSGSTATPCSSKCTEAAVGAGSTSAKTSERRGRVSAANGIAGAKPSLPRETCGGSPTGAAGDGKKGSMSRTLPSGCSIPNNQNAS